MIETQPPSSKIQPDSMNHLSYKFAICGGTSSGKTCILAALAMPRSAHPGGFTACMPHLPGTASDDLKQGHKWVSDCVEVIENGSLPEPNAIKDLPLHTRLRYQFTTKGGRESFVDIFDYSGELMEGHAAEAMLAGKLRDALAAMDGLLVVAEHPRQKQSLADKPSDDSARRLHDLGNAFALLRHEERSRQSSGSIGKPIAVLVNKWDRAGTLTPPVDAQHQAELLASFVENSAEHKQICAQLEPGALNHLRIFAVSALGPGKDDAGSYKPAQVKPALRAFGLEDPFVWLMEAKDAVDLATLEERVRNVRQWWNFFGICKTWRIGQTLHKRIMPKAKEGRELFWLHARATFALVRWCAMLALLGVLSFAGYHAIQNARDNREWSSVDKESDLTAKAKASEEYLAHRPQGLHKDEANRFLRENRIAIQRDVLQKWLADRNTKIEAYAENELHAGSNDALNQLSEKTESLASQSPPHWDVASEGQRSQYRIEEDRLHAVVAKIMGRLTLEKNRAAYFAKMNDLQLKEAADMLLNLDHGADKGLLDHFRANILDYLERKWRNLDSNGSTWKLAEAQTVSVFTQPVYATLMPKSHMDKLAALSHRIRALGDRYFYDRFKGDKMRDSIRAYLGSDTNPAALGSMKREVESYLRYLDARGTATKMTLSISSISWNSSSDTYWHKSTVLKLYVLDKTHTTVDHDDKYAGEKRTGTWTNASILPSVNLSGQAPNDRLEVIVQLWAMSGWLPIGRWSSTITMEDLHNTEQIAPAGGDYGGPTSISFTVSGLPGEPRLPEWHDIE